MLFFSWLPRPDRYVSRAHTVDCAHSVYFLGRRSARRLAPLEAIRRYEGAHR
jgi:hypothetical protein